MSWKDYFFFTKQEKRGLLVLLLIIVVLFAVYISMPYWVTPKHIDSKEAKEQIALFEQMMLTQEGNLVDVSNKNKFSYHLQTFNPNIADSSLLISLGLKPYIVSRIIKYRQKGGKFFTHADLAKIYGITTEDMDRLSPYMVFNEKTDKTTTIVAKDTLKKEFTPKDIVMVDVNLADTIAFKSLRGVGTVLSKRIVAYRERLGGFVTIHQLKEVYGISEELFEAIAPNLQISAVEVSKMEINKLNVHQLKQHPYISFYQAKIIEETRLKKSNKRLQSLSELPIGKDITSEFIEKITPYCSFN